MATRNRVARGGLGLALLIVLSVLAAACSGTTAQPATTVFKGAPRASGSWPYPNGDLANTRDAVGSTISSANVSQLREAWSFKLAGPAAAGVDTTGSFAAAPVVVDGVVYMQDLDCNVYALSLASGKLLWQHQVNTPEVSGPGPNGVAVAGGRGRRVVVVAGSIVVWGRSVVFEGFRVAVGLRRIRLRICGTR